MGKLPNYQRLCPCPDTFTLSLGEKLEAASDLLLHSRPDLEEFQLEILHIHHLFQAINQLFQPIDRRYAIFLEKTTHQILNAVDYYVSLYEIRIFNNPMFWPLYKLSERKARGNLRRMIGGLDHQIKSIFQTTKIVPDNQPKKYINFKQDVFVGRAEDVKRLKYSLVENVDKNIVVLVGVEGVGKTCLAHKLFNELGNDFSRFAWVSLPKNEFRVIELLQELMLQLTRESREKIMSLNLFALAGQFFSFLIENKSLVVLDNVSSTKLWMRYFPQTVNATKGKLLVLTRVREVGDLIVEYCSGTLHVLEGLPEDESWDLIARQATLHPGIKIDTSRELIGKEIARKCNGLPEAINLLGKHLGRKNTLLDWSLLNQNVVFDQWNGKQERGNGTEQLLGIFFMDLPLNLKHCLLYMAVFLENSEIDTNMLYILWIVEGLVQLEYGGSMETVIELAAHYLQELASRGMVEVEEDDISTTTFSHAIDPRLKGLRKFRSCRLNSIIRDMCRLRAKEENYLTVMDLRRIN